MPYPEDLEGTYGPTQREETLSETEKHWNQVILAFLAIGTTVLGVTLIVYGRAAESPSQENLLRLVQATATVSALVIYLAAFLYTARTIFPPITTERTPRLAQKRRMANTVIALFALLAMTAAAVIFIEIVAPDSNLSKAPVSQEPTQGKPTEEVEQSQKTPEATVEMQVSPTEPLFTPTPISTLK